MLKLPEVKELNRLFNYDEDTGIVTRATKSSNSKAGSVVGSSTTNGYLRVSVNYQHYALHRIIYKMVKGVDPYGWDIDHINGDRVDNRIQNLRLVDRVNNMRNAKLSDANTSGKTGVSFDKVNNKWQAQICINYKVKKLGRHLNKEDAIAARVAAENFYGFHANHGRSQ